MLLPVLGVTVLLIVSVFAFLVAALAIISR